MEVKSYSNITSINQYVSKNHLKNQSHQSQPAEFKNSAGFMWNVKASHLRAQTIAFTGRTTPQIQETLKIAKDALNMLESNKGTGTLIKKLEALASKGITIGDEVISNGLTKANIQENGDLLIRTLKASIHATQYEPTIMEMKGYKLFVNNNELLPFIKPAYTLKDISVIEDHLTQKGVYKIMIDKESGLVKTSTVSAQENFEMGARYWITDSCHNLKLQKKFTPESCSQTLKTWARFFNENIDQIDNLINDPGILDIVREGKANRVKLAGMPHIGILYKTADGGYTLTPDGLFNRFRQESHGNLLSALTKGIIDGANKKSYGLKSKDVNEDVVNTISSLTRYFEAIKFHEAPSNGNWEETPFKEALTHDTAVITDALKSVRYLMNDSKLGKNKSIQTIREKLKKSSYGDVLSDKNRLDEVIKNGEDRVKKYYNVEAPGKNGRQVDASQAYTVRVAKFDDDPVSDAIKKMEVLKKVETELQGEYGVRRYNGDSYLGTNYTNAHDRTGLNLNIAETKSKFGSKDCSTPEMMEAREKLCGCPKEETAQWFFNPVLSQGYGRIAQDLIQYKKTVTDPELLKTVDNLITESTENQAKQFNRTLARITGESGIKSSGEACPAYAVPEAYECVSTLELNPETGEYISKFIPGAHSSLTWAQTEIFGAQESMKTTLKLLSD